MIYDIETINHTATNKNQMYVGEPWYINPNINYTVLIYFENCTASWYTHENFSNHKLVCTHCCNQIITTKKKKKPLLIRNVFSGYTAKHNYNIKSKGYPSDIKCTVLYCYKLKCIKKKKNCSLPKMFFLNL